MAFAARAYAGQPTITNRVNSDVRESFVRQRRALIATGIVLTVYLAAGLKLDDVNVLGTTVKVTRPEWIQVGLWILWSYFLLRYYQLMRDLADPGPKAARAVRLDHYQLRRARAAAEEAIIAQQIADKNAAILSCQFDAESVIEKAPNRWVVSQRVVVSERDTGKTWVMMGRPQAIEVPSRWQHFKSAAYVSLHTRYFTEYQLPLVIASFPPVMAIAQWLGRLVP